MEVLLTLIEIMVDYCVEIFIGILFSTILFFSTVKKRKRYLKNNGLVSGMAREITLLIFFIYIGCVIALLIFPHNFFYVLFSGEQIRFPVTSTYEFNFIPTIFLYLTGAYSSGIWVYTMFAGNIIMFIPLGFFTRLLWENISVKKFLLINVCLIISIEVIQSFIGRSFDSNDIILNILGGLVGFVAVIILDKWVPQIISTFRCKKC